ncbi:MAG: hypothetical protein H7Y88_05370 [Phycisphaerales bacterium]|nr:hypothetical protein [Phycisphaerales bacterium]
MDDRISRVESLSVGTGTPPTLVSYARVGLDMVAGVDYPTPDVQLDRTYDGLGRRRYVGWQLAPLGSYAGWDRFGRVKRQSWLDGTLTRKTGSTTLPNKPPILETIHSYDAASNRLNAYDDRDGAKIVDRDWEYEYDGLDRLKEAQRGGYNGSGGGALVTAAGSQQWALDMLGNWATIATDLNGNGSYDTGETEERDHNKANEITDRDPDGGASLPALPFTYDNSGNMRQQNKSSTTAHVYTHDAWNRLVKVQLDSVPPSTAITLNESEYNGLHWRTVKKSDTTSVPNGLDEKRLFYYSAAWQMIQEDIDTSYVSSPGTNNRAQQVWGLRYIDDAVARRTDSGANGSYESTYYYVTDAQFSVVAILSSTGVLQERVRYEAYGKARHSWPSDVDGDGDSDTTDSSTITGAYGTIGATAYNADCDINRSGAVDATDLGLWIAKTALPAGEISHLPDNSVGYDGYLFNREFQVYTVRFRNYEPVLGRWLERDPLEFSDSMNMFQFVRSMPLAEVDPFGLVGGTIHHPYPLYLGGSPDQPCFDLNTEDDHNRAHRHIDGEIRREAGRKKVGRRAGETYQDFQRRVWKSMSNDNRKRIIRESLQVAGVSADAVKQSMSAVCKNSEPGANRTCERRRSRGGVRTPSGSRVGGIIGAAGGLMATIQVRAAMSEDPDCERATQALQEFHDDPSNCAILQDAREAAEDCFLSIGDAVGGNQGGVLKCSALSQWDELIDLCTTQCQSK